MKFEVGDIVKFTGECSFIKKGWVGVVVSFDFSYGPTYGVDFERDEDDTWSFSENELELVE